MTLYQCWADPDGGITLACVQEINNQRKSGLIGPKAEFCYEFYAGSWNEAMTKHHEKQGWEPYKPMEDDDE